MAFTAKERIALLLPGGVDREASFTKNGVRRTIKEAITDALDEYSSESANPQWKHALADLLDILASDIVWETETMKNWTGDKELMTARAQMWRERADNDIAEEGDGSAALGNIDIDRSSEAVTDEWSH